MAGTIISDTIKSSVSGPTVFQNTSGTEIGQLCKAWVNFNGVTTTSIRASFNVSSVTRNTTGDYTVNFTNALTDANYAIAGIGGQNIDGGYIQLSRNAVPATTSVRIEIGSQPGLYSPRDASYVNVAIFR